MSNDTATGRKVYENSRYIITCREWEEGAFVFDLYDKKTGVDHPSYSQNLKEATDHVDFYEHD